MNLLVGCPISHREWILPEYFRYSKIALDRAKVNYNFVFLVSRGDQLTLKCLLEEQAQGTPIDIVLTEEPNRRDERRWNPDRYQIMVDLRNTLLKRVRQRSPDLFLSLDSDILLHPDAIKISLEEINDFDALGMCTYMSEYFTPPGPIQWDVGRNHASKGSVVQGRLVNRRHYDSEIHTVPMEVIMAAKLMKPSAYGINYAWHMEGEDIGWSLACKAAGLKLAWCPRALGKHVMDFRKLNARDPRVGF